MSDIAKTDMLMDDIQLRVSDLILERRKLWDEVQQLKTQRDNLRRILGDYKAIAEGWEDLYRRAQR